MGAGASMPAGITLSEETTKALESLPDAAKTELMALAATAKKPRYNTLREKPSGAKYKLCVVQFKVPGAKNGGSDKGPDGNRVDSIPIANSVIEAGGECDLILFDSEKNKGDVEEFTTLTRDYHALIVRINPQRTAPAPSHAARPSLSTSVLHSCMRGGRRACPNFCVKHGREPLGLAGLPINGPGCFPCQNLGLATCAVR